MIEQSRSKKTFASTLFLLLVFSVSMLYFVYPIIARDHPEIKKTIDDLRGYYTGPLFINDGPDTSQLKDTIFPVHFTLPERGKVFYLTAAAGKTYLFSIKIGIDRQDLAIVNLYNLENNQLIISNKAFPFATGRLADAFSAQGEALPEHSNYLKAKLKSGKNYLLEILPKDKNDIGKQVVLHAGIIQNDMSLEHLLAMAIGMIVGLYVLFYGAKVVMFFVSSNNKGGASP